MKIPRSILHLIAEHHQQTGDKARLRWATSRIFHMRAVHMYGYDHPVTVRYREAMHRYSRELNRR